MASVETLPGVCPVLEPHKKEFNPLLTDNFTILQILGEGTFGLVVQAVQKHTHILSAPFLAHPSSFSALSQPSHSTISSTTVLSTPVAIKIINKKRIEKLNSLKYVYQEISIHKQLIHPNIPRMHQLLEDEENLYLVMEYVPGVELFTLLQTRSPLSESEGRLIFFQMISALAYLHYERGLTHRDIKLENIIVSPETFHVKIIDFGLARFYNKTQLLTTCCGADVFAAPEIYNSFTGYNPELVDVWSAGVVLWALLTGFLPFKRWVPCTHFSLMMRFGKTKSVNASLSLSVRNLFEGMLQKDPNRRFSLANVLKHPWLNEIIVPKEDVNAILEEKMLPRFSETTTATPDDRRTSLDIIQLKSPRITFGASPTMTERSRESFESRKRPSIGEPTGEDNEKHHEVEHYDLVLPNKKANTIVEKSLSSSGELKKSNSEEKNPHETYQFVFM